MGTPTSGPQASSSTKFKPHISKWSCITFGMHKHGRRGGGKLFSINNHGAHKFSAMESNLQVI